jgi:hypothetical protein
VIGRMFALTFSAATLGLMPALASPLQTSPRPVARQATLPLVVPLRPKMRPATVIPSDSGVASMAVAVLPNLRPQSRPLSQQQQSATVARPASLAFLSPGASMRPLSRPDSVVQQAQFWKRKKRKGAICGIPDIQGERIGNVPGRLKGCGISDAVRVRSVSGVRLNPASVMNCPTAEALNQWVDKGMKPAFRRSGPVVEMRVIADYNCRTRNNIPGAKISEHGKGKALDISAFTMQDGQVITVLESWGKGAAGRALRKVWKSACGPFGTVLGPDADRYHQTHFHVDTASYRGGAYCK